ncbi:nitrate/nitrite two-component system sensor histidine kinase NarQ [Enterovibrio sp. ZSDZ35]|uniref:Sensor protein n=1 Tax=Enterovibrio qingdaonensis TaxID=2899818 RepID=A0ABT5QIQ8_9GAMM|nr:nitrate/nitrite two-component system sensor histidine kinase NarQ [Enterovibrio sp. ZSDZ35]MDD1780867.1 nitrate/nitrite two-component system sensor histidine kinase NarQ [Enterovibrio sp. ZSDZ35]
MKGRPNLNATVKKSVTTTVARALLTILTLAVIITGFSIITLASSLNDAAAVNTSGSLRMQSYRLAYDIVTDSPRYADHIGMFEASLLSPELQLLDNLAVPEEIRVRYDLLIAQWLKLRPDLEGPDRSFYLEQVGLFVNEIDRFVFALQTHSENKLQVLALVSSAGLGLILAVVIFLIHYTQKRIVNPLNQLVLASQNIQKREFDIDLPAARSNELGVLTESFGLMANELKELYADLESKIELKTQKLTKANRALNVLYDCSTQLSSSFLTRESFTKMLAITLKVDGVQALRLRVNNPKLSEWEIETGETTQQAWHTQPLKLDGETLGALEWQGDVAMADTVLLSNLASVMARGIYYNHAHKQATHVAVMEERATLARELHDSIAQSLSYLKIQTSLLKRHLKLLDNQECDEIANEISLQLGIAYNQLRELLNAFRLSLTNSDFGLALHELVKTLQMQVAAPISIVSSIDAVSMDAQRQMHILQIIREACANAIKHAQADEITIKCHQDKTFAYVDIIDNGNGFELAEEKPDHYGLNIMQERAQLLGGDLRIVTSPDHGCTVSLVFSLK